MATALQVEMEQEVDGRWIADITAIPGCMVYGATKDGALNRVIALALRVFADRIEAGEPVPELDGFSVVHEVAA